jgi:hypothetical protein
VRRALTFTAVGLVVVLLLGLVAGGWYYSDQLLPAPPPYEPVLEVEVLASDEAAGTVELATTDGDLVDLATVGLVTADGLIVLEGPADRGRRRPSDAGSSSTAPGRPPASWSAPPSTPSPGTLSAPSGSTSPRWRSRARTVRSPRGGWCPTTRRATRPGSRPTCRGSSSSMAAAAG